VKIFSHQTSAIVLYFGFDHSTWKKPITGQEGFFLLCFLSWTSGSKTEEGSKKITIPYLPS